MGFKNDICIMAPKMEDLVESEFLGLSIIDKCRLAASQNLTNIQYWFESRVDDSNPGGRSDCLG